MPTSAPTRYGSSASASPASTQSADPIRREHRRAHRHRVQALERPPGGRRRRVRSPARARGAGARRHPARAGTGPPTEARGGGEGRHVPADRAAVRLQDSVRLVHLLLSRGSRRAKRPCPRTAIRSRDAEEPAPGCGGDGAERWAAFRRFRERETRGRATEEGVAEAAIDERDVSRRRGGDAPSLSASRARHASPVRFFRQRRRNARAGRPRVAGGAEALRAPPTVFARQGSGVPNSACARIARHRPHPFAAWRHFGHPSRGSGPLLTPRCSSLAGALHGRASISAGEDFGVFAFGFGTPAIRCRQRRRAQLRWTRRIGTSRVGFVIGSTLPRCSVRGGGGGSGRVFVLVRVCSHCRSTACVPPTYGGASSSSPRDISAASSSGLFAPFVGIVIFGRLFHLLLVALRLRRELAPPKDGRGLRRGLDVDMRLLCGSCRSLHQDLASSSPPLGRSSPPGRRRSLPLRRRLPPRRPADSKGTGPVRKTCAFPHAPPNVRTRSRRRAPPSRPTGAARAPAPRWRTAAADSARRRPSWTAGAAGEGPCSATARPPRRWRRRRARALRKHQAEIRRRRRARGAPPGDSCVGSSLRRDAPRVARGCGSVPAARAGHASPAPGPSRAVVRPLRVSKDALGGGSESAGGSSRRAFFSAPPPRSSSGRARVRDL